MIECVYIPWTENTELENLKKEIIENDLEIKIIGFVARYQLFGHKFLWKVFLKFQNPIEKRELKFFQDKISKKEFYLKSKIQQS